MHSLMTAMREARFDAYAATFQGHPGEVIEVLRGECPGFEFEAYKSGKQGYRQAWRLGNGEDTALLLANSAQRPNDVHLSVQGSWSHHLADFIREVKPDHRVSRVDACIDFDQAGAFDALHGLARNLAEQHRVKTSCSGDWEGLVDGRTYYIGAPTSVARTRIYEKGCQLRKVDPAASPDLVRLETQVRPQKDGKVLAAQATPMGILAGSIVSRELLNHINGAGLDPVAYGNRRKPPSASGVRLSWLSRQYGSLILNELLPAVGGSISDLADLLLAQCADPENPRVLEDFTARL